MAALLACASAPAGATTVTVPDDWPTIQQAIDSGAETVLVRPGIYPETLVIARAMEVKGLVPYGTSPNSLPVVSGVVLEDFTHIEFHTLYLKVWSLRILSQVRNQFETSPFWDPLDIEIAGCALDGGLVDSDTAERGQIEYYLRLCRIGGPVRLSRPQQVWFQDCTVRAAIQISGVERFSARRCDFRGPSPFAIDVYGDDSEIYDNTFEGFETPIRQRSSSTIYVSGNTFIGPGVVPVAMPIYGDLSFSNNRVTGFQYGVLVPGAWGDLYATQNLIADCGTAVRADVRYGDFLGNEVRSCEVGVFLNVLDGLQANDNVVRSCGGDGMILQASWGEVNRNVVGHCGGDGIRLTSDGRDGSNPRMIANTVYRNGGAGLVVAVTRAIISGVLDHNIAFENGRHGLESTGPGPLLAGCNDWFGNAAGAISGAEPSASDLAVDPLFCDAARDDVHLSAGSPLLDAPTCGLIGALGRGCDMPTVSRLTTFTVASTIEGVEVRWQVADAAPGFVAWLERAEAADGPWVKAECERASDGEVTVEYDRSTAPARSYWYRLVATDRGVTRALGEPIHVDTAPPQRFALLGTGPNPAPGAFEATFQLAHAADITLELFDAQGRRVATLARGAWPAGIHHASWAATHAASGLYLVRYRHPAGEDLRRIALVR